MKKHVVLSSMLKTVVVFNIFSFVVLNVSWKSRHLFFKIILI